VNWIISKTKIKFHTLLHEILKPIWQDLADYDWILTDLDFMSDEKIPIDFDHDYFVLNSQQFEEVYQSDTQIIWGIISAVPKNTALDLKIISRLSAEDENAWKPDQFLIQQSIVEIIALDSSYTIAKFKDEKLSEKFKEYFKKEAIELEKFTQKYIK